MKKAVIFNRFFVLLAVRADEEILLFFLKESGVYSTHCIAVSQHVS